jgi:hypothetical protein
MAGTPGGVFVAKPGEVNFTIVEDVKLPEYNEPVDGKEKIKIDSKAVSKVAKDLHCPAK